MPHKSFLALLPLGPHPKPSQDSNPPIPILNPPLQTSSTQPSKAYTAPSALSSTTDGLRADPLAALYLLSSNATLFFVIGTFAALKKPMTYTNGVQISLETRSCVFIVLLLVGGGGGQDEGKCVMMGTQLLAPAMANGLSERGLLNSLSSESAKFWRCRFKMSTLLRM